MNTSKTEHTTVVGPYTPQRIALTALKKKPGETLANLTLSWGRGRPLPTKEPSYGSASSHVEDLDPVVKDLGSYTPTTLQLLCVSYPALQLRYLGVDPGGPVRTRTFSPPPASQSHWHRIPRCHLQRRSVRTRAEPLRYHFLKRRWTLLGEILRLSSTAPDLPAYRYMEDYFKPSDKPMFCGRQRTTLPVVLDTDLRTLPDNYRPQRSADFYILRCHAQDPKAWRKLIQSLLAYTPLEERDPTYANVALAKRFNQLSLN
ncbi:hypothetical protein JG687_00016725 [Phytophthora cactorum]|uniref:Uncharacterized protein n=1 Tax=Phytophthora cactorum TaxID=29920 RepID=A0A8T1TPY4_9STRA|nr:hypothetical protein JG687_00016725 [Phytophthora cactorum]